MSKKELKTNAMRILDRNKIPYEYETYECDEFVDGITTADKIGLPHEQVYKTLVTVGKTGGHYVFVIPIAAELDLKKAAKSVGEKSVEMLHVKDITAVTGYVRGGCTAIGMKKQFPTVIDSSAPAGLFIYVIPFLISTVAGSILAFLLISVFQKSGVMAQLFPTS